MIKNKRLLKAALKAHAGGLLHFRCTDAQGRPCNGGDAPPLKIGKWSDPQEPVLCESGWHVTDDPAMWRGDRLWLVEGKDSGGGRDDKHVYRQIRPLAEIRYDQVLSPRHGIRVGRKDLTGASLYGAKTEGAIGLKQS